MVGEEEKEREEKDEAGSRLVDLKSCHKREQRHNLAHFGREGYMGCSRSPLALEERVVGVPLRRLLRKDASYEVLVAVTVLVAAVASVLVVVVVVVVLVVGGGESEK